jgi:hypothetical protein
MTLSPQTAVVRDPLRRSLDEALGTLGLLAGFGSIVLALLAVSGCASYLCWTNAPGPWPAQLALTAVVAGVTLGGALAALCCATSVSVRVSSRFHSLWHNRPLKESTLAELSDDALALLESVIRCGQHGLRQSLVPPPPPEFQRLCERRLIRRDLREQLQEMFVFAHRDAEWLLKEELGRRERKLLQFAAPGALSRHSGLAD